MKKITILVLLITILNACKSKQAITETTKEDLYEIVYQNEYQGSEIKFYEMVTEADEFKMLMNMHQLKKKINESDIETSNFIILNSGMKSTGGYAIGIESVEEFPDKILVKVKEESPKMGENVTMAISYPMCIVKINSKKKIVIK